MQLEPSSDQLMMKDTFARFLDAESSIARVRAALPRGFDAALWAGLGAQGALGIRVPEQAGGSGLGLFDAVLLMEEAGRTLVSGPLAEAIVAARLLAQLDPDDASGLRDAVANGQKVVTLAMRDIAGEPEQLVAGGAVAEAVIARKGEEILLVFPGDQPGRTEKTLASTPIGRLKLGDARSVRLGAGPEALAAFAAGLEEWKLLAAAALTGLANEAIRIASAYACERSQFGRPIGAYQAISHPLAQAIVEVDAGRLLIWRAIRDIAEGAKEAGATVSTAIWWACQAAGKAVDHGVHTHGGYGLTIEYDIHLFSLRAKAWPLMLGDPDLLLDEAGRRRFLGEGASLPDAGEVSIDFGLGEGAEALGAEVRAFFEKNMTPEIRAKSDHTWAGHDPGMHKKLADAGLLFPAWPKHMGGRGASRYAVQAALRAWDDAGYTTHPQGTANIIGYVMDRFGTDQLKSEVLTKVAAGEATCCLGFSEPGSGSDVFAARTRATFDGEGWRIDGQKMFTTGAEIGDYLIMLARSDPDSTKHAGLTMFIVPLKSPGVTVQAVETFPEERTNITYYDGVRVPDAYRLGEVGQGARVMAASLEIEHGSSFFRFQRHMLECAERLCRTTQRNGQPLIEDPRVTTRLARVAANCAAAQLLHYRALWVTEERKPNHAYGPASKMFSSEAFRADSADLLNLTAPESLASASADAAYINRAYRHSQLAAVYGGTTEVHRSMIAEKHLGLPRTR
jgi:alkylation response protein AidB-like acyl-CoA dehydrogenase